MTGQLTGYVQTGIGVVVSVILFVVSYRQTIGARRQRALLANDELRRALLRRMVLEQYQPNKSDVTKLSRGKARAHRVPLDLMDSVDDILTDVFTLVFDNDLLPAKEREGLQRAVLQALESPVSAKPLSVPAGETRRESGTLSSLTVLAASLAGAVLTFGISVFGSTILSAKALLSAALVFVVSVGLTSALLLVRRVRERTLASPTQTVDSAVGVFSGVREILKSAGLTFDTFVGGDGADNFDYLLAYGGENVAIEALSGSDTTISGHVDRLLRDRMKRLDIGKLWVVTLNRVGEELRQASAQHGIEFLSLEELRERLTDSRSRAAGTLRS